MYITTVMSLHYREKHKWPKNNIYTWAEGLMVHFKSI